MLKQIAVALAVCAFAGPALADEELAGEWGQEARELYEVTVDALQGEPLPETFDTALMRFSVNSTRLGAWIDERGGPSDLGCIFRGMAEEAELQLGVLERNQADEAALRRLATLFYDAEGIALAAINSERDSSGYNQLQHSLSCPADPEIARQYLIEQP